MGNKQTCVYLENIISYLRNDILDKQQLQRPTQKYQFPKQATNHLLQNQQVISKRETSGIGLKDFLLQKTSKTIEEFFLLFSNLIPSSTYEQVYPLNARLIGHWLVSQPLFFLDISSVFGDISDTFLILRKKIQRLYSIIIPRKLPSKPPSSLQSILKKVSQRSMLLLSLGILQFYQTQVFSPCCWVFPPSNLTYHPFNINIFGGFN